MRHWYKNSVIYSLDVKAYMDSNSDGIGDFKGLTNCLDYLNGLGINCLWLLPIYDTPGRDNGYDVRDYYKLNEELGDFGDFSHFLEETEERGIHVVLDLPFNHTSIDHPWFQKALEDPDSKYRDYYIWTDDPDAHGEEKLIFGEQQSGNWCEDEASGQYYYHTFYAHEADLNFANPEVRHEIQKILRFWLRQGVSGFRFDAAPHMIRRKGSIRFERDPHEYLQELRTFVEDQSLKAMIFAEVDVNPDELEPYFGEGDEFNVLLNFYLCNYLFLALAREEGKPIAKALEVLPNVHHAGQWANFLRNHDELDLERLAKDEFEDVMEKFAPEDEMRIFGRGIRRRVAPMLEDDRPRMELAYSLLLTLPGTPVLYYGDEIAMGEKLDEKGRDAVRTAMQWSDEPNGAFSQRDVDELVRPIISEGKWGYKERNVTDQRRDRDSFLSWMIRAIHQRLDTPEFGEGEPVLIDTGDPRIFAHRAQEGERFAIAVHNLCGEAIEVDLGLDCEEREHLLELFADQEYDRWELDDDCLEVGPYGYRWFRRSQYTLAHTGKVEA
ncbi:trehalose synthase [Persicimonas caeni]|uniref:Alpha-amylase n=1 Tax=Persicimonas caeni TaxID=2292766 RepID=A0A4Y6PRB4_PERCE|nr:alpha-amylase family protein [Persicimonas caeni]QDG50557.1 trehalose synthase [Persicimonas caeni]QED31778.1 trehalose synthase [Persicimonas caeni]